ncbi:hypothetical protein SAMN02745221_00721 [Thermosyntropha lipolytica DSM 11003]|uniref:Iron-only hydrogenase system regulator n=1 Tax=Thermosyntropha lipolytica DSM 11003 TaxID=1123382 RepID=A0A1M5LNN5_9FIRM|nr:hypothetical protein [Thermosyntropha lipolytica]SHG66714.1 hypothetical protein SAMN02745221_00721 [Thermosyntropha lipolytica DSM 11003]
MSCLNVMGILVRNRSIHAKEIQEVLTKYGCIINVRVGIPKVENGACTEEGLIMLQLCGTPEEIGELKDALNAIPEVKAECIELSLD